MISYFALSEIIDFSVGTNNSKFTKSFINQHKGIIPVYSASQDPHSVDYGYVADFLPGIKYFENCLTWNIDGSIGSCFFRKGRFSLSEKVIPLVVKEKHKHHIDLFYLAKIIESIAKNEGFGFGNKAGAGKLKNIKIPIPVKENGEFDRELQQHISEQFVTIEELKNKITDSQKKLEQLTITVEKGDHTMKEVRIDEIFDLESGFSFKSKKFVAEGQGISIVRIQNLSEKNPGFVAYPNEELVSEKFLVKKGDWLLPLSGSFFRLTERKYEGKYYLNQRIAKLTIRKEFEGIQKDFLLALMQNFESELNNMGYSMNNNLRVNDIKKVVFQVPILPDGSFDLATQHQIAQTYETIAQIKSQMLTKMQQLQDVQVVV